MADEQQPPLSNTAEAPDTPAADPTEFNEEFAQAAPGEIDVLREALELAEQQAAEAKDQAIRALAEAQNIRRRAEKDVGDARKYALDKFAAALLAVADNLERAIEAADASSEQVKPLLEGVELTHKNLLSVFSQFNIVIVDPQGEPFDPSVHQAVSMVENAKVEPNSVLHVMQKGYRLNERLLRPAMVVVSKAAVAAPAAGVDERA